MDRISEERYVDLLRTLSHEIRAPLNLLSLASLRIKHRLIQHGLIEEGNVPEDLQDIFETIDTTADRIGFIVTTFTQEFEPIEVHLESTHLFSEIVAPILSSSRIYAEKRNKYLNVNTESLKTLPAINGDLNYARTAFYNVLDNAIKFSKGDSAITISGNCKENSVSLTVENYSNVHILDEEKDKIFERYYRGSRATFQTYEGSGIGLSIAKKIMNSMKGELRLSNLNNPTIFELEFRRST